jgi:phosphoribosylaminoimidazolecarboxamide formyltransferase/IMP cyclohydrolase
MAIVKTALISVFNKEGLENLVPHLEENDFHIYSTGGTMSTVKMYVKDQSIVRSISDYTEYPEICGGRVKTLHPKIYGGILGLRNDPNHIDDLYKIRGRLFDLVVVNLYPFEEILKNDPREDVLLENIDIGGHTLLRAASKNYKHISVLSSPLQYEDYINNKISNCTLAKQAMATAMKYDIAISNWMNQEETVGVTYHKVQPLKYGLNPYMIPAYVYTKDEQVKPFETLNGSPGYINLLDAYYAIHLVLEAKKQLDVDCCTSYKHNSPAGVALGSGYIVLNNARHIDPKSSFGDMIGYSGVVDVEMAKMIRGYTTDGIIASDFTEEALEILKEKKKGSYVILKQSFLPTEMQYRDVNGVTLVQPSNTSVLDVSDHLLEDIISLDKLPSVKDDMILGYTTLKYTQSNCVCFVCGGKVIGIGAGQQNRVDCIKIAGDKAEEWVRRTHEMGISGINDIVLVSDAFLPFPDNVEVAAKYNVKYILQPGGSIRDEEVKESCKKYNITMIMSGLRTFTH